MALPDWIGRIFTTRRSRALKEYRRGVSMAKSGNDQGAIEAYTHVIEHLETPRDVLAMALFNRGLVYVARGELVLGTRDLKQVADSPGAPERVCAVARQKLIRMKPRVSPGSGD